MGKLSKTNQSLPKQAKKARRREPVKVVYICTPVWVETTASEFRARVIELTGRHSDIANISLENDFHEHPRPLLAVEADSCIYMDPFDMMDEDFNPQLLDNFSMFYGSFALAELGPSLDNL